MDAHDPGEFNRMLKRVRQWPPEARIALVRAVLQTLPPATPTDDDRAATLDLARGLLATDRPPPSDEDIARWLDERRMTRRAGSARGQISIAPDFDAPLDDFDASVP